MKAIMLALLLTLMPQQVKNGTVSVIARDAITQQGISGVFVNLTYKFPREPAGASTSLLTDQQGRATFNVPPGNYQMAAERQGYAIPRPCKMSSLIRARARAWRSRSIHSPR